MMAASKPKIAFFDFTGCEGCQLTAIDSLQNHPDLLGAVEIVQFREAMSEKGEDFQIAFVEGACSRPEDEIRLQMIRDQAEIVIAFGACAHLGGVNALRNWQPLEEVRTYVYGQMGKHFESNSARPIEAVIRIEGFIPGCPIDGEEFIRAVKALLQGRLPSIPDYPVCVECRLRENVCVFLHGAVCLGPITRAGCQAICPTYGLGCIGCRGQISQPNHQGLKWALTSRGFDERQYVERMQLFQSYAMLKDKVDGDHG
jgi:sulfhydrogenase subunit delta